jgi:uncharacterized protein (DUF1810 family)
MEHSYNIHKDRIIGEIVNLLRMSLVDENHIIRIRDALLRNNFDKALEFTEHYLLGGDYKRKVVQFIQQLHGDMNRMFSLGSTGLIPRSTMRSRSRDATPSILKGATPIMRHHEPRFQGHALSVPQIPHYVPPIISDPVSPQVRPHIVSPSMVSPHRPLVSPSDKFHGRVPHRLPPHRTHGHSVVVSDIQRFVNAQKIGYQMHPNYAVAYGELTSDKCQKLSHWIWYVFPQLAGLIPNPSPINQYFSIRDIDEAIAYLKDDYLRDNYIKICTVVLNCFQKGNTLNDIFGPDDKKVISSATLFLRAATRANDNDVYQAIIELFMAMGLDKTDMKTNDLLDKHVVSPQIYPAGRQGIRPFVPSHTPDVPGMFPGPPPGVAGMFPSHTPGVPGMFPGSSPGVPGMFPGPPPGVPGHGAHPVFAFMQNFGNTCFASSAIVMLKQIPGLVFTERTVTTVYGTEYALITRQMINDLFIVASRGGNPYVIGRQDDARGFIMHIIDFVPQDNRGSIELQHEELFAITHGVDMHQIMRADGTEYIEHQRSINPIFVPIDRGNLRRPVQELIDRMINFRPSNARRFETDGLYYMRGDDRININPQIEYHTSTADRFHTPKYFMCALNIFGHGGGDVVGNKYNATPDGILNNIRMNGRDYEPISIICHIGNQLGSGHYVNYVRGAEREWLRHDDGPRTITVTHGINFRDTPYVILYNRLQDGAGRKKYKKYMLKK